MSEQLGCGLPSPCEFTFRAKVPAIFSFVFWLLNQIREKKACVLYKKDYDSNCHKTINL